MSRRSVVSVPDLLELRRELRIASEARLAKLERDARLAQSLRTPFVQTMPPSPGNLPTRALQRLDTIFAVR